MLPMDVVKLLSEFYSIPMRFVFKTGQFCKNQPKLFKVDAQNADELKPKQGMTGKYYTGCYISNIASLMDLNQLNHNKA